MTTPLQSPLLPSFDAFINGKWVPGDTGRSTAVHNPATGELLGEVTSLSEPQMNEAVAAAQKTVARPPSMALRKKWLLQIERSLLDNTEELGRILTLEHGKPWSEGKGEVAYSAGFFAYAAANLDALEPRDVGETVKGGTWTVHQRPSGVAGLITPWNFPLGMIAKKLSAAIAGGCPSVIKPASKTPLTMIALFALIERDLDMPDGFVNLVMGSASMIGRVMCEHPDVPVISFTGSTDVGKTLVEGSKGRVKRLSLELGGNAPFIVFDDADLELAADQLIGNKFRGSGQTCVCTNRVLVQKGVAERFTALVAERTAKLKVGDGMLPDTDIGPLIDRAGWQKVQDQVQDALNKGATKVFGPEPREPEGDVKAFFPPTVLSGVTPDMECCKDETFGPLVPMVEFETLEEAIIQANNTQYGLASYVFTTDDAVAEQVIARLQFGHVGWNSGTGPTPEAPFGGWKESGYGREGGLEGMFEFVEAQTVVRF